MRYQGKVTNWKDDQGFGFVTPNGGGQKAFVHINSFSNRTHRPLEGDLITYELAKDEKGRFFAKNIRFVADRLSPSIPRKSNSFGTSFAILFCIFIAMLALIGRLPLQLVSLYLIASIVTFIMYALDKSAAQSNRWRTKESTLHLLGLIGGWPGALLAQRKLRHKSKKEDFQTIFWITVFVNCFTLGWIITTKSGSSFLSSALTLVS